MTAYKLLESRLPEIMPATALAPFVGVPITAAAAIAASFSAYYSRKSSETNSRSIRADMFLKIAEEWKKVYKSRNTLLSSKDILTMAHLEKEHGTYHEFICTDLWRDELRPLCNFYETLGIMLDQKVIQPGELFDLVTVDVFKATDEAGNTTEFPDGLFYKKLQGPIDYLRKHYRQDLYRFYDKFLLEAYKEYVKKNIPNQRDLPAEARALINRAGNTN